MQAKCVTCDILLDVACAHPTCTGHQNESLGDMCVYCATNERETTALSAHVCSFPLVQFSRS